MAEHKWTVTCNGDRVAGGWCPDLNTAMIEGMRYAVQYTSEGSVALAVKEVKPRRRALQPTQTGDGKGG